MTGFDVITWENSGRVQTHKNVDCKRDFDLSPDGGSDQRALFGLRCVLKVKERCIYVQCGPSALHALRHSSPGASQ